MAELFSSVRYFTTGKITPKVEDALDRGGARRETYFTDYTTHLIVGQAPDEDVVAEAYDLYERPALRTAWVLLSAAAGKLLPTPAFSYRTDQVFRGLRLACSRLEAADVRAISALVTYHGGVCQRRLDAACTHLVVGEADGAMYARCVEAGGPVPVTPDWVVASAREGRLAEAASFHPRLLVAPTPADPALAAITGFGEQEDRKPSGEQEKQQLLAMLKQNLPWNQPDKSAATSPAAAPAAAARPAVTAARLPAVPESVAAASAAAASIVTPTAAGLRQMSPRVVTAGGQQLQRLPVQLQQSSALPSDRSAWRPHRQTRVQASVRMRRSRLLGSRR